MKTGKQIFQELILDKIDRTVTVKSIVSVSSTEIVFTVCRTKWMRVGQSFSFGAATFNIINVDIDTNTVTSTVSEDGEFAVGSELLIVNPTFLSGTPLNLNGENKLRDRAGVDLVMPIVWLFESISGSIPEFTETDVVSFDFDFYCLDLYNYEDWLNDDRHAKCIYPMTQLRDEILNTIDREFGIERNGKADFTEFSRFGREDENGFKKYILDLNLSGIECRISVEIDREGCNC